MDLLCVAILKEGMQRGKTKRQATEEVWEIPILNSFELDNLMFFWKQASFYCIFPLQSRYREKRIP